MQPQSSGTWREPPFAAVLHRAHGAIMAATVLKSERAIHMSIFVVRAFVRVPKLLSANHEILAKLAELDAA